MSVGYYLCVIDDLAKTLAWGDINIICWNNADLGDIYMKNLKMCEWSLRLSKNKTYSRYARYQRGVRCGNGQRRSSRRRPRSLRGFSSLIYCLSGNPRAPSTIPYMAAILRDAPTTRALAFSHFPRLPWIPHSIHPIPRLHIRPRSKIPLELYGLSVHFDEGRANPPSMPTNSPLCTRHSQEFQTCPKPPHRSILYNI